MKLILNINWFPSYFTHIDQKNSVNAFIKGSHSRFSSNEYRHQRTWEKNETNQSTTSSLSGLQGVYRQHTQQDVLAADNRWGLHPQEEKTSKEGERNEGILGRHSDRKTFSIRQRDVQTRLQNQNSLLISKDFTCLICRLLAETWTALRGWSFVYWTHKFATIGK